MPALAVGGGQTIIGSKRKRFKPQIGNEDISSVYKLLEEFDCDFKKADKSILEKPGRRYCKDYLDRALCILQVEGHAVRLQGLVSDFAENIDLPEKNFEELLLLARYHDIGKAGIPEDILFKPGPLTAGETMIMRRHCDLGHSLALSSARLAPIAGWILMHHESWDGRGYPMGLKGEEIPLECRILAIADAYDAMTNDRPYRRAMSQEEALAELKRCSGTQFDPELVYRFIIIRKHG